jgi:phosphatidylethanolamine/phosphatidyl-N-methylethanolamine N-methyltransferase
MNNLLLLWKEVLRSPRSLGTIAPSSKWLAMDLIEAANLRKDTVTVEIGAGTGPLTEWIINTVEPVHFIALEPNPSMASRLRERFPGIDVCEKTANCLPEALEERGCSHADRILCSLPWSLFSEKEINHSLDAVRKVLSSDGTFLTLVYTHAKYLPSSKVLRENLMKYFSSVEFTGTTWRNLPPGQWLVCREPIRESPRV